MMQASVNNPKLDSLQEVCDFCRPWIQRAFSADLVEQFYREIQFYLLGNQFSSNLWASGMDPKEFRDFVISNTSDWPSMEKQIRNLLKRKRELGRWIPWDRKAEITAHLYFLLGMPWIVLRAHCKLIRMIRSKSGGR